MKIVRFAVNGVKTLRSAARGRYNEESDAVRSLRMEMLTPAEGRISDVQNIRRDRMMVGRDARVSFNKIVSDNG